MQALQPVPPHIVNLADHEAEAQRVLDANAWAYVAGGAGDEHTLRRNAEAWPALHLRPRVLRPLLPGHTGVRLLGQWLPHPIVLAPVAHQRLFHPDGERATALAAAAQGAGLVVSAQASTPLADVARLFLPPTAPTPPLGAKTRHTAALQTATSPANTSQPTGSPPADASGPLWLQLTLDQHRATQGELLARAVAAGYHAVVLTVDAPLNGVRDRERRTGFRLPPGVQAVNLPPAAGAADATQLLQHAATWADVCAWIPTCPLPVLIKGVLHPDDARQARDSGAAGVVVSNHGGRTLDTALPTAWALPAVAQAVGQDLAVLVDGGIRRGTDVFKALALGAHAVLVGRPFVHGLAHSGATGVAHVVRLLRDEWAAALALCGCATAADIRPDHLFTPPVGHGGPI